MDGRVGSPAEASRILVVDDCETSLLFQEYALQGVCHVLKARDGEEALRLAASERIDLILLDLGLPGVDGLEVLRRLRAREADARTPVVVVSVRGEDDARQAARQSGCSDYLTKPVALGDLVRVVRRHLED